MKRSLELWGGLECTVARVGDDYRDQSLETGYHDRIEDLDRIAELGIRTLRHPVLWETISPEHPDLVAFATAERLYVSRDGGRFWTALAVELPSITAVAFAP